MEIDEQEQFQYNSPLSDILRDEFYSANSVIVSDEELRMLGLNPEELIQERNNDNLNLYGYSNSEISEDSNDPNSFVSYFASSFHDSYDDYDDDDNVSNSSFLQSEDETNIQFPHHGLILPISIFNNSRNVSRLLSSRSTILPRTRTFTFSSSSNDDEGNDDNINYDHDDDDDDIDNDIDVGYSPNTITDESDDSSNRLLTYHSSSENNSSSDLDSDVDDEENEGDQLAVYVDDRFPKISSSEDSETSSSSDESDSFSSTSESSF